MKRLLTLMLLFVAGAMTSAQNYPTEWIRYTSDAYFHDIEKSATKQAALEQARVNLARQIQVRVDAVSKMDKQVVNGRSAVYYNSTTNLSTDVDMDLAETRSYYDESQGETYVLVFIDKSAACTYYENEIKMLVSRVDNVLAISENYIGTGFKQKAKAELQKTLTLFDGAGKPFFWLNVFGLDKGRIMDYLRQVNDREQTVKQRLADLEYGTTYCVVCEAELFGRKYSKLANEVKGELVASGCNFVDDPTGADVVIRIDASARKYNEFQGAYFIYVDAAVSVVKNATGQRIFEDEVSVKGGHTLGYDEAARDGYKKTTEKIVKLLKENIKL